MDQELRAAIRDHHESPDDDETVARWDRAGRPPGVFSHDPRARPWVGDFLSTWDGQGEGGRACQLLRVDGVRHHQDGRTSVAYARIDIDGAARVVVHPGPVGPVSSTGSRAGSPPRRRGS